MAKRSKILHRIMINCRGKDSNLLSHQFLYNYGSTKGIELALSSGMIIISARLTRLFGQNEMLSSDVRLFSDAIQKGLLCHLLLFSESIVISKMYVQIGDNVEPIEIPNAGVTPLVYSIVVDKLKPSMSAEWSGEKIINQVLSFTKSSYDSRMASLFSLICAKSKRYHAERFIYLWMAFNGMYNYYVGLIKNTEGVKSSKKLQQSLTREWKQIVEFQKLYSLGSATLMDPDKTVVAREVISLVRSRNAYTSDISAKEWVKNLEEEICSQLTSGKNGPYNLTAYGYMLTQFSYYFRRNVIHANKPIALFSYAEETDLKCLAIINGLLEEFLDENLYKYFDTEYLETFLQTNASTASTELTLLSH